MTKLLMAAVLAALAPAARAGVTYDLLNLSNVHTLWTGPNNDYAYFAVCETGELSGDGIPDLVLYAPEADQNGDEAGSVHVFFGPLRPEGKTYPASSADVIIHGSAAGRKLGACWVQDVNNDKQDDLIVQHTANTGGGAASDGDFTFHVYFGPLSRGTKYTSDAAQDDVKIWYSDGNENDSMSMTFGDVNGDRITDVLIKVPGVDLGTTDTGAVYVLYGPLASGVDHDLESATAYNLRVNYSNQYASNLFSEVRVADVSGDGANDLILGGSYFDGAGGADSGAVWVSTGPFPAGTGTNWDFRTDATKYAVRYDDPQAYAYLARLAVADFNSDGKNDLCMGAPNYDGLRGDAGAVFCVLGPISPGSAGTALDLAGSGNWNVRFDGANASDYISNHGLAAEDLTNDGVADLVVMTANYGGEEGALYIHNGGASWPSGTANTKDFATAGAFHTRITSGQGGDYMTWVDTLFKDFDGDGNLDIGLTLSRGDSNYCAGVNERSSFAVYHGPFSAAAGDTRVVASASDLRLDQSICRGLGWGGVKADDWDQDGILDVALSWRRGSAGRYAFNGYVYHVSLATAAPRVLQPGLFTSTAAPTVVWTPASGATSYRVVVDQDPRFTSPVHDSVVTSTSSTLPTLVNGESYYVRVKAESGDFTRWGPVATFTVDLTPPVAPTLLSPGDATGTHPAVNTQTPAFDWTDASTE